jgi:hypothetical protein
VLIGTSVVAAVAGCTAATPTVVALDDPDTTLCLMVTEDGTAQSVATFVQNTGTVPAVLSDFQLVNPSTKNVGFIGAYLTTPEAQPFNGAPFSPATSEVPLTLEPGAKKLLAYGISLVNDPDAHTDGISFRATSGGTTTTVKSRMPVQIETTPTGCEEFGQKAGKG